MSTAGGVVRRRCFVLLLGSLLGSAAAQDCDASSSRDTTSGGESVVPPVEFLTELTSCSDPPAQDCAYCKLTTADSTTCASWENPAPDPKNIRWPLYVSYALGIVMAYAIGGNDSANSLATSVGSGALGLRNACIMGAVGEFIGATLLGAGVSSTIQRGVADINDPTCWACGFCNSQMPQYQTGMLAALFGASFFLMLVTFWALPVSTTHSVVGGVVGMTMAAVGPGCLNWSLQDGLGRIAAGWVVSPLVSGGIGSLIYIVTYYLIFKAKDPKAASVRSLPACYGLTFSMMTYLTLMKTPLTKDLIDDTQNAMISIGVLVVVALFAQIFLVPAMRIQLEEEERQMDEDCKRDHTSFVKKRSSGLDTIRRISDLTARRKSGLRSIIGFGADPDPFVDDSKAEAEMAEKPQSLTMEVGEVSDSVSGSEPGLVLGTKSPPSRSQMIAKRVFKNLVVLTAFIKCVGHGANDTANATGIVGAVQFTYNEGRHACGNSVTPTYIMAVAGFFVGVGVITMGYRVIQTVGKDMADIDFHVGFCVEFSSACAVVVATILGLPVSTTHCQIGSIVFVAATAYGCEGVAWGMFAKIGVSWLATLPAAGGVAFLATKIMLGN